MCHSSDLYHEELLDDIKKAYQDGLVDPACIRFDNVNLAMGEDRILARLADDPHLRLVEGRDAMVGVLLGGPSKEYRLPGAKLQIEPSRLLPD